MAGFRGHISIAVIAGVALAVGLGYSSLAVGMPLEERLIKGVVIVWLAVLFGLFPDIDIKSKGQMLYYRLFFALDLGLLLLGRYPDAAFLGFLALIPIISRHRGWTHTFWAMVLVPLPILAGPMYIARSTTTEGLPYYLAAVAGYFSHLLVDGTFARKRTG